MNTEKVSLSLPSDLLDEARGYIGSGSLSAYVVKGLQQSVLSDHLARYLSELDAESGPLTAGEIETARREWHGKVCPRPTYDRGHPRTDQAACCEPSG